MKCYAFVSNVFDSGCLVKLRSEQGWLISVFETKLKRHDKIKEVAKRFCPDNLEFEWIDEPHTDASLRIATNDYEKFVGVGNDGYEIKERWSF